MAFALRHPYGRRGRADGAATDAEAGTAAPRRGGTARVAAGRSAWALGSVMVLIARIVRVLVGIAAAIIVAAILLRVLGANASNSIVSDIHSVAKTLVGPFNDMFSIKNAKVSIAVNWGIAAAIYLIVGAVIARLIARAAPRGLPPGERVG